MVRVGWNPGDFGDESYSLTLDGARNMLSYSRSSADRLLGVYGQDQEIEEWAGREGYTIVGHARDVKVHSQSSVDDRQGLSAVVEAIRDGKAAGVVVHKLDRLARDWYIQDQAVHAVWDVGGRVFSTDYGEWKPDKPGDPQWNLRKKYAEIAEAEYHALLQRLQAARRRKIARGGYGGGHRIRRRYGVELVSIQGKLEYRPIPEEQTVIKRICAETGVGVSYSALARDLNAEGVRTATGAPWSKKVIRDLALRGPDRLVAIPEELPVAGPIQWTERKVAVA